MNEQTIVTTFNTYEPVVFESGLRQAISAWRSLLGSENVSSTNHNVVNHGRNAYGSDIRGGAILKPQNVSQIPKIVEVANENQIPLYPISTGRNWGYGAASPTVQGSTIVDLSALTKIRIVDRELGIVSLQPGVTQGMLAAFLKNEGLDLMVPVHGGGPSCSLLGNALERGYGLTPTTDHFAALTALEAVLPDGSVYKSAFHAMCAEKIGSCHRWGVGPYAEGLFSQGNFGIVTEGTFALQRRPEHVEAFFIQVQDQHQLTVLIEKLRTILSSMGACIAGVNLMNDLRMLSMTKPYPIEHVAAGEIISDQLRKEMAKEAGVSDWTAAGIIHCPRNMRSSIRKELRRLLPKSIARPIHMNRQRVRWAKKLASCLPVGRSILRQMSSVEALLDLADGIPQRVALPLAYWLRGDSPKTDRELNPAKDGCGLIWYSPLVPMKSDDVQNYVQMVTEVCTDHQIEPLITLTSLSERLFDSTVPILFRPEVPGETARAQACYSALLEGGRKIGCLPYRVGTLAMKQMSALDDGSHGRLIAKLKHAVDPNNIIAPGRYSPVESPVKKQQQ